MSEPAHVIIEFGRTRMEFYRHWGGSLVSTGPDLLQKLADAPHIKARPQFHDGGYLIRQMLEDSDGSLPQYQIVAGEIGQDWDHGYHLRFVLDSDAIDEEVGFLDHRKGHWEFRYTELEGWETSTDWVPGCEVFSLEEFTQKVQSAIDEHITNGSITDLDIRDAFLTSLKFKKG